MWGLIRRWLRGGDHGRDDLGIAALVGAFFATAWMLLIGWIFDKEDEDEDDCDGDGAACARRCSR